MEDRIQGVVEALNHGKPASLPRGELFVTKGFLDRLFPEEEGNLFRQLGAAARAMGLSLVGVDLNEGASGFPSSGAKELEGFFVTGYVNGPVSRLIDAHGFAKAMIGMRKQPQLLSTIADDFLLYVETCAKAARGRGVSAIALADDIAGSNGLLFSFDYFAERVCPVYEAAANIIKENGLFAFFHSDGDMRKVLESLVRAGYDCIHPVDALGGLDLYSLKEEFGERITFMGHMDVMAWGAERIARERDRAEREFKKGGLILGSMGGISVEARREALCALYTGIEELIPA